MNDGKKAKEITVYPPLYQEKTNIHSRAFHTRVALSNNPRESYGVNKSTGNMTTYRETSYN